MSNFFLLLSSESRADAREGLDDIDYEESLQNRKLRSLGTGSMDDDHMLAVHKRSVRRHKGQHVVLSLTALTGRLSVFVGSFKQT